MGKEMGLYRNKVFISLELISLIYLKSVQLCVESSRVATEEITWNI